MRIEPGGFGRVLIDGVTYSKDVLILKEGVKENWWRKDGHSLVEEDLPQVFENPPAVFVMGCGYHGVLKVPAETRSAFQAAGIDLRECKTPEACALLSRLLEEGEDVAGGLHLTC
jgi:hypothetical protein